MTTFDRDCVELGSRARVALRDENNCLAVARAASIIRRALVAAKTKEEVSNNG